MNSFEFAAAMIGHLIWPLVVLVLAFIFRSEIRALLGSLRRFSWGDKVAEFDKRLHKAEDEVEDLPQRSPPLALPPPTDALSENFEAALEVSPDFAVLEAWRPVERELEALAARCGYETSGIRSPTYAIRRLRSDGIVDRKMVALINELRALRNLAIHRRDGPLLSIEDARRYEDIATTVVANLRALPEDHGIHE